MSDGMTPARNGASPATSAAGAVRPLLAIAGAAAAIVAAGFLLDARRAFGAALLALVTLTGLSLAGTLFLALLALAGARWADALKPVARAMGAALPAAFALGLLLLPGVPLIYEWAHGTPHDPAHAALLERKAAWLNVPGFALRLVACFAIWVLLGRVLRRRLAEPRPAAPRDVALAAGYLAAFAITWSVASVDWIQSLEPDWYSTIFALRTATGLVVGGLAAATLLALLLRDRGALRGRVTVEHAHDLGRLLLSFTILWVYVGYCQHMLIWYTDIPEEAAYFARRGSGGWRALAFASLGLGFVVPFLVLLPRRARRSPAVLMRVALALLVAQALDLYGMIGPAVAGAQPALGPLEIAGFSGALALFFGLATRALVRADAPRPTTLAAPRAPAPARGAIPAAVHEG